MWVIGGVLFGVIAAVRKGTIIDRGIVGVLPHPLRLPRVLHRSLPAQVRGDQVGDGRRCPSYTPIAEGGVGAVAARACSCPALTLALLYMAGYVRMTRAFVLESMSEDYVRTARAKGLQVAPGAGQAQHAGRADPAGHHDRPGLRRPAWAARSSPRRCSTTTASASSPSTRTFTYDLPTIIGLVLLLGTFVIVANIIVDVLYAVIDPRVRVG